MYRSIAQLILYVCRIKYVNIVLTFFINSNILNIKVIFMRKNVDQSGVFRNIILVMVL